MKKGLVSGAGNAKNSHMYVARHGEQPLMIEQLYCNAAANGSTKMEGEQQV